MSKLLTIKTTPEQAIKDLFSNLLESEKVSGVFSLRKMENGAVDYGLITNKAQLDDIAPLHPLMPANAGQILSRFTPLKKPIAAVIKPCEFRAVIEMVKREQGSLDNYLLITYTCGGAFPIKMNTNDAVKGLLSGYHIANAKAEIPNGIRPTCRACEYFAPENADILISVIGEDAKSCKMYLNTDKALELTKELKGEITDAAFDSTNTDKLKEARLKAKEDVYANVNTEETGLDGMIEIFGRCVGCHGCNSVCPICYCTLCDFESNNFDYNAPIIERELKQKKALRLPPDTLFFHIGRLTHMSFSCVACGMCSDVCPASIPVASVFKKSGERVAKLFDFVPGRDAKEDIPVMIYKEEEFGELGK
jgi:formate dehydrogenase (coenzyme F420) beta subunit